MSVFHQHATLFLHGENAPARIPQLDHIARPAIDRVVLVQRRDLHTLRLQDHLEDRRIRYRSAIADRRHARAAARV